MAQESRHRPHLGWGGAGLGLFSLEILDGGGSLEL